MRCPVSKGRAWSWWTTAFVWLAAGAIAGCGAEAPEGATAAAAPAAAPADKAACHRWQTCVPDNPCHTGWVTGCRAGVPICTDIGGWISNGTACGDDVVCHMGECVPCAAGDACEPRDPWGQPLTCQVGTIACGSGQPVCEASQAPDGSACWPGSEPYYTCTAGQCGYCPHGMPCQPPEALCHQGSVDCWAGGACADTGAALPDGSWCGDGLVCRSGDCAPCTSGATCTPEGMPCWRGATSCSTGAPACSASWPAPEGEPCGDGLVCSGGGSCVPPCLAGATCTPQWSACRTGTMTCYGPTSGYCAEGPPVEDGTSCGDAMVCVGGSCASCGPASWCPSPDPCHASGAVSCATGRCEGMGEPFADGTSCGVGGESCRAGVCTGAPGARVVVRAASYGSVDLTGTSWTRCMPDEPEPGWSRRATDTFSEGAITHVEELFPAAGCSGEASSRTEIVASAVTAGDRVAGWASQVPPDGLPWQVTATAITFSGADPGTGEPFEFDNLYLVNDWSWPRKLYDGENDRALAPDGYPTLLVEWGGTEVLPCTEGEPCANPNGTCEVWRIQCSSGFPACAPSGEHQPDGSPCAGGSCQGGACLPGPGVTGSRWLRYWPDAGAQTEVPDPSWYGVGAYWPDGGGAYFPGWASGASFEVPGVPDGSYVLELNRGLRYFIATEARSLDLGEDLVGRADAIRAFSPTPVTFTVDGLAPWQANDSLQLVCGNTGTLAQPLGAAPAAAIPAGATAAAGTFDWLFQPLLATADAAYLFQASGADIPGTTLRVRAASRWGQLPPVAIEDGVARSISVSLSDADMTSVPFASLWPTSAFESHLAEVNPAATLSAHRLAVLVKPHSVPAVAGSTLPFFPTNAAHLLISRAPQGAGDLTVSGTAFGRFLPEHWVEYRDVRLLAAVPIVTPQLSATYTGWVARTEELAAASTDAAPTVTPPLAPRLLVGGVLEDAFLPRTGVGTGPLLAWSPPAVGVPTSYTVTLLQPTTATSFGVHAIAITSGTSFRFPDGVLSPGETYFAVIMARSAERERLDAPLRMQFDADFATAITAPFTP